MTGRIESLTSLRFLAALVVVFFHYNSMAGKSGLLSSGPQMVTFFFILSGFVLVYAYQKNERFSKRRFWTNRVARVLPLYLLALGLAAGILWWRKELDFGALVLNIFMVQAWFKGYALTVNSPGWSLCIEAFFYFLFPFAFMYCRAAGKKPVGLMVAAFTFWLVTVGAVAYMQHKGVHRDWYLYFPPAHLASFALGMAGAYMFLIKTESLRWLAHAAALPVLGGALLLVLEFRLGHSLFGIQLPDTTVLYGPLFLAFVLSAALTDNRLTRLLSNRTFVFLGEISYGVYILQSPIKAWCQKAGLDARTGQLPFFIYLTVLLLCSALTYTFVERPAREKLRLWLTPGVS